MKELEFKRIEDNQYIVYSPLHHIAMANIVQNETIETKEMMWFFTWNPGQTVGFRACDLKEIAEFMETLK